MGVRQWAARRRFLAAAFLAFAGLAAVSTWPVPASACQVSVGWNDWPPYLFKGTGGRMDGFDARLVTTVLDRVGCSPVWLERPWARMVAEIEAGRLDMAPWATRTPERERFARFSAMYLFEPANFIVLRGSSPKATLADFKDLANSGLRIGAEIGAVYSSEYGKLVADGAFGDRLLQVANQDQLVKLLQSGRVDGILSTLLSARLEAGHYGFADRLEVVPFAIPGGETHFMFSLKTIDAAFVARFDAALAAMLADGSYDAILKDYDPSLSLRPDRAPRKPGAS